MSLSAEDETVSSKEAARMLGISNATLRSWRSRGNDQPDYFPISESKVVYKIADVRAWLEARRKVPAQARVAQQQPKPWERASN